MSGRRRPKMSDSDRLAAETIRMEAKLRVLRAEIEKERAMADRPRLASGDRWSSAQKSKGSLSKYDKDVHSRMGKVPAMRRTRGGSSRSSAGSRASRSTASSRTTGRVSQRATSGRSRSSQGEVTPATDLPPTVEQNMRLGVRSRRPELENARRAAAASTGTGTRTASASTHAGEDNAQETPGMWSNPFAGGPVGDVDPDLLREDPTPRQQSQWDGQYDEAAERRAFQSAVESWRRGGAPGPSGATTAAPAVATTAATAASTKPPPASESLAHGQVDEAAERRAFQEAVAEWRRGGKPAGTSSDTPSGVGAGATAGVASGEAEPASLAHGEIDEEAERRAFQEAVAEWRRGGPAAADGGAGAGAGGGAGAAAAPAAVGGVASLAGGEMDEEAERRAFQAAVAEWRSGGGPETSAAAPAAAPAAAAAPAPAAPASDTSGGALLDGDLNEEAERMAFQAAVAAWRAKDTDNPADMLPKASCFTCYKLFFKEHGRYEAATKRHFCGPPCLETYRNTQKRKEADRQRRAAEMEAEVVAAAKKAEEAKAKAQKAIDEAEAEAEAEAADAGDSEELTGVAESKSGGDAVDVPPIKIVPQDPKATTPSGAGKENQTRGAAEATPPAGARTPRDFSHIWSMDIQF